MVLDIFHNERDMPKQKASWRVHFRQEKRSTYKFDPNTLTRKLARERATQIIDNSSHQQEDIIHGFETTQRKGPIYKIANPPPTPLTCSPSPVSRSSRFRRSSVPSPELDAACRRKNENLEFGKASPSNVKGSGDDLFVPFDYVPSDFEPSSSDTDDMGLRSSSPDSAIVRDATPKPASVIPSTISEIISVDSDTKMARVAWNPTKLFISKEAKSILWRRKDVNIVEASKGPTNLGNQECTVWWKSSWVPLPEGISLAQLECHGYKGLEDVLNELRISPPSNTRSPTKKCVNTSPFPWMNGTQDWASPTPRWSESDEREDLRVSEQMQQKRTPGNPFLPSQGYRTSQKSTGKNHVRTKPPKDRSKAQMYWFDSTPTPHHKELPRSQSTATTQNESIASDKYVQSKYSNNLTSSPIRNSEKDLSTPHSERPREEEINLQTEPFPEWTTPPSSPLDSTGGFDMFSDSSFSDLPQRFKRHPSSEENSPSPKRSRVLGKLSDSMWAPSNFDIQEDEVIVVT